ASFQKVGTFQIVGGQKQGGNVVSYFLTANGGILDAVAGPVDAATFLREARWVVETRKMGQLEAGSDMTRYMRFFRAAHAERLPQTLLTATINWPRLPLIEPTEAAPAALLDRDLIMGSLDQQGGLHLVRAVYPLMKLNVAYKVI